MVSESADHDCYPVLSESPVYFVVTAPLKGGQWSNGAANQISWSKGLLDDVNSFDIEMSRMSVDGLTYIASYGAWLSHSWKSFTLTESFRLQCQQLPHL